MGVDVRVGGGLRQSINPIATAYFRAAEDEADISPEGTSADAPERAPHPDTTDVSARSDDDIPTSIDAVVELLAEAGVMPDRPRALLEAADGTLEPRESRS